MSIHKVYDLLSRPFKPEDITELFEKVLRNKVEMSIMQFKENIQWEYSVLGQSVPARIIDQFISDTQRNGEELFWKEEIVNQYFK